MQNHQPICPPDLSSSPFRFTVERVMEAPPDVLYRAWTELFDCWFATPGTLLMKGEVNAVFFWEVHHEEIAIRTTVASSGWSPTSSSN